MIMTLSLSHSHTHTHTHSSIGVRVDNTARRGTQNAPQFRQWNWNNREGEEKVLAVGPPQCSVAMAVVQCKTSDSEMRDSFFSFSLSLSLSLFAQRSALGGWKSKSPSSSSFSSSQFSSSFGRVQKYTCRARSCV